jgi:hypothetical protein
MKKTEIIQLALIVLGVLVIVNAFETITYQLSMMVGFEENRSELISWILIFTGVLLLLGVLGFVIINYSDSLAQKMIKEDKELSISAEFNRIDILSVAIIILSLYFLLTSLPTIIFSLYSLLTSFFGDFVLFKEILPNHALQLIQYLVFIIIFIKANSIAGWIEKRILFRE